jgi:hypothetical protein
MCSLHRQGFVICRHLQIAFHFNDFNVKLLCQGPFTYILDILGTQSIGQIGSGLVWFDLAKRWNNTETSHIFALYNGLQLLTFADCWICLSVKYLEILAQVNSPFHWM